MFTARIVLVVLGVGVCSVASADTTYRLKNCAQYKDGVSVGFIGARGEKRRMYLSPRGVELGGDVKGYARLYQVKEFELQPVLGITYTSGAVVRFGSIDASCDQLLRQVGAPLVRIKG
jgi:hypothetical protein